MKFVVVWGTIPKKETHRPYWNDKVLNQEIHQSLKHNLFILNYYVYELQSYLMAHTFIYQEITTRFGRFRVKKSPERSV